MVKRTYVLTTMWAFLILPNLVKELNAYDLATHQAIAERTVGVTSLSSYLRDQLGLPGGVTETFLGQRVDQWIISGARTEDIPDARVRHHFHNPLRPWAEAGLTFGISRGESSLLWNQEPRQDSYLFAGSGSWSWHNARKQYLDALTQSAKSNREKSFADLFRSLGQGTHLLQDATVPAHVRNDAHLNVPVPFTNLHFPDPDGYEKWALNNAASAGTFIGLDPTIPPLSIFTATGDSRALSPVARLFDTDKFQSGNSGILSDPALGVAEFTNGNFLSKGTIFRNFTLPSATDLALSHPIEEITDGSIERYFSRTLQTGETVTHFVREGMLRKALRSINLSPAISSSWVLDDRVHADYARLLLPRAVGYSASLLDYFFRGKLDVDVSNDPTDPTMIRLEGKNGSTEKLDGGTLELYGEDSNGVRTAATPVGSNVVVAGPGQPISLTFRLPPSSDKLMAVYKGKLGDEAPQGDFIGAVIGKIISPQRVEQIFTDFARWYVRSPQGVFPLPLLKSDVDDLQWGDSHNMMVGRSRIGPGQPNVFYTYRINRTLGATHIPLTVTNEIDIQTVNQYSFPFGTNSGTTVQFSHVMPYKQYLLWEQVRNTQNWVLTIPDDPSSGVYVNGPSEVTHGINLLVDETKTTNLGYSVILDESSHVLGSGTSRYLWDTWSIHLTADGRPLALVQVQFTTNNLGTATVAARTLGAPGDSGEFPPSIFDLSPVQVPFALPELGPMWLLVDVTTGQILANTAPPTLTMIHTNGRNAFDPTPTTTMTYRSLSRTQRVGGPQAGFSNWAAGDSPTPPTQNQSFCSPARLTKMDVLASASISPTHVQTQLTQNRSEVAQVEFADMPISQATTLNFPIDCGDAQRPANGFRMSVAPGPLFAPNNVGEFGAGVLRTTPVAGNERLVFLISQAQDTSVFSQRAKLIAWNPALSRIDAMQEFNDQGLHALTTASRDAALFVTIANGGNQSRLFDFNSGSATPFSNQLLFDYALLDPAFFYNTSDFKFHVKDPSLASMGQPLSLAPAPSGNPLGRYHVLQTGGPVN